MPFSIGSLLQHLHYLNKGLVRLFHADETDLSMVLKSLVLMSCDGFINQTQMILHAHICTYCYTSVIYKVNICPASGGPALMFTVVHN